MAEDKHLETLRLIWREIKSMSGSLGGRIDETNQRLDQANQRLDQTNQRLDQTNQRLDQTNQRLDHLESEVTDRFDRANEMNMRILTEILAQAKTNQMISDRFESIRHRVERIEARLEIDS